jgi:hypothetical protein
MPSAGVVYLRFPESARPAMATRVCELVERFGDPMRCAFIVVQPGKVRVTRTP